MEALQAIYQCLGGLDWTRQNNWLSDKDPREWQGVTCSGTNVTAIELSANNLRGRLDDPKIVAAFVKFAATLEQLWLSENTLTGSLPAIFADESIFPHLVIFDVGSNQLRGSLHPAFSKSRVKPFSFFDISGNQLTSYYRYTTTKNNNDELPTNIEDVITAIATRSSSPLLHVHVVPVVVNKQECTALVDLAIEYAANAGWQTNRHKAYQTTDIDISVCGGKILEKANAHLSQIILPLMARLFSFALVDLAVEDLFLAKYSACKDQQSMLPPHRDDSELSFVITLNDNFTGGGTRFVADDLTMSNCGPGTGVFFCGRQLHSGVEVVSGTRYILAGFVRVYPSTPQEVSKLKCLLEHYKTR